MILGVIGKTGSGKSSFANYLKGKEFQIVDLDKLGKRLPELYSDIILKIKTQFGSSSVINGSINRKYLAEIVFSDKLELEKLNKIFFPYFKQELQKIIKSNTNILIDGVILFEADLVGLLDKIIYIDSSPEISLSRLLIREKNTSLNVLKNRIIVQKKYESLKSQCDFVITNNSSIKNLYLQIEDMLTFFKNRLG